VYRANADHTIELTELGHTQAAAAGKELKALLDSDGGTHARFSTCKKCTEDAIGFHDVVGVEALPYV
jgi:hypothetical protein